VASIVLGGADFKSYLEGIGPGRGRPERPSGCAFCDGERIWFDGWRFVFCVLLVDGTPHRFDDGLPLQRVVCAACHISWTLRPAFLYPHRSFEPDVVEAAGSAYLSDPASTFEKTAEEYGCSPRSVWRWVGWLATVVEARALLAEAERLSGAGQTAALVPRAVPQDHKKARSAARERTLLTAFQALCALAVWGRVQPVPPADPSPLRFWLHGRFQAFREVHRLVPSHSSPPLPGDCTGPP
jgi:hypothetical protein